MITLPNKPTKITSTQATVDFYEFTQDNLIYYYFDCSLCSAPEPMMNAMIGLRMLEKPTQRLVMINHSIPNGLFPKIKEDFEYEVSELSDGTYQIVFAYKNNTLITTDFEDNHCSG